MPRRTHGMSRTRVYKKWAAMLRRCEREDPKTASHYKDRGITVCERWKTFEKFYADMGHPQPGTELDRIDGSLGYFKDNCRWVTKSVQMINRRSWRKTDFPKYVVPHANKFKSYVRRNNIKHYVGIFKTADEAHKAAAQKAKELDNE